MPGARKQNYLHGAMILTVSAVIIKILGAVYKIPLYNILGTDGTSDFTVAYRIFGVLLTLSTAGLPLALSRLISEARVLGRGNQVNRTYRVSYAIFVVLGGIGTFIMLFFPKQLAVWMNDSEAAASILALSPAVLLVCLMSAYRGYIQGHSDMIPTAVSQVLEVAIKVAVGLFAAWMLYKASAASSVVSAGAILGVSVASALTLLYLIAAKRKLARSVDSVKYHDTPPSSAATLWHIIKICVPIVLSSCMISVIALIDTKIALDRLQNSLGMAEEAAKRLFGEYTYANTVSDLPATFTTALAIAVVPAIASLTASRRRGEIRLVIESSLRVCTLIILPMGIGMTALASPVMNTLYYGKITDAGVPLLAMLGIVLYFTNMALMTNAALQAAGHERLPILSMCAGVVVKVTLGMLLIGNPRVGIFGAPLSTVGCFFTVCVLNMLFLRRALGEHIRLSRFLPKPLIACAGMGLTAWAVYGLLVKFLSAKLYEQASFGRVSDAVCMLIAIAAAVIVYLLLVVLTKALTPEDLKLIPKGDKLARLLRLDKD